jgi:uncharacterized DUF497 family protein
VVFEWDDAKAQGNLRRHGVSFEEGVEVFFDTLASTIPDRDHSGPEDREITMGHSYWNRLLFASHLSSGNRVRIISVRKATKESGSVMKKNSAHRHEDDLRPEYDLRLFKGGVRGKYYQQAIAGTNLVLIEPDLAEVFPDTAAVNRALRLLVQAAAAAAKPVRRGGQRAR